MISGQLFLDRLRNCCRQHERSLCIDQAAKGIPAATEPIKLARANGIACTGLDEHGHRRAESELGLAVVGVTAIQSHSADLDC
jgi:hypothetical protein